MSEIWVRRPRCSWLRDTSHRVLREAEAERGTESQLSMSPLIRSLIRHGAYLHDLI